MQLFEFRVDISFSTQFISPGPTGQLVRKHFKTRIITGMHLKLLVGWYLYFRYYQIVGFSSENIFIIPMTTGNNRRARVAVICSGRKVIGKACAKY